MDRKTALNSGFWLLIGVVYFMCLQNGLCQTNNTELITDGEQTQTKKDPLVDGMEPLFIMTNGFLGMIQPESKGNKILDVVSDSVEGREDQLKLPDDWQELVVHYIGYVICIAIGLVYFIFLPIVGFCFCCCRCCGNCGGKNSYMKGSHDRCLQITFGIIFAIINVLILAGMVCAFVTNELVRQQTSQEEKALVPTVGTSLKGIESFKDQTIHEVRRDVLGAVTEEIRDVTFLLGKIPENAKTSISQSTGATQTIADCRTLASRTQSIYDSLVAVESLSSQIQTDGNTLTTELTNFKTNADSILLGISPPCDATCTQLRTDISGLTFQDYDALPDVSTAKNNIKTVLDGDLNQKITTGEEELDKISTEVESETSGIVTDSESSLQEVDTRLSDSVDDLEKEIKEKISLNKTIQQLESYEDDVETYGDYRFYAGIGLSCILLLILLFNILGLAFGICGEPPYDDASTCNKGVGANLLLAGVGFTFIFAWLLMLVVIILFAVGGLLQTEVCTIIVDIESSTAISSVDQLLEDQLFKNSSLSFKLADTLDGCKRDEALYKVLNLDNVVNLTEVLDIKQYNIEDEIDKLRTVSLTIPDINLYTTELETSLNDLKSAGLDDINFSDFNTELAIPVTTPELEGLITSLESFRDTLPSSSLAYGNVENLVVSLKGINDGTVANIKTNVVSLQAETQTLESHIKGADGTANFTNEVTALQSSLQQTEDSLHSDAINSAANFLADQATDLVKGVSDFLDDLADDLQNNIGKCRALYSALDDSINAVCESTLRPFNGFWFSFGWCLLFFIPSIIFAVKLAGLFRKYEDYEPRDYKNFDDPNFAAYSGEGGESVAMQQRNIQQRNGHSGKNNTGYERDDYTASRSANYRTDSSQYPASSYDPGYHHQGYGGGGGGGGGHHPSSPPNPPHYHNHQHSHQRFEY